MKEKEIYPDSLQDISPIPVGTLFKDWVEDGVRAIVLRAPWSFCAYIGVPLAHPLAGFDYNMIPVNCHGGLTYADRGGEYLPEDWYWYGWDYSHFGDFVFYSSAIGTVLPCTGEKLWTLGEITAEVENVLNDFIALAKLAEAVQDKIKEGR